MKVLCSRNARPQKGLVRRPQLDLSRASFLRESNEQAGGSIYIFTGDPNPNQPSHEPAPDRCLGLCLRRSSVFFPVFSGS